MQLPFSISVILLSFFLWANHASSEKYTYIVRMDKSSMPKAFLSHHSWYSSLLKSAKSVDPASLAADKSVAKLIYTYDHAFHGFSAVLSREELQILKKSGGFLSASVDNVVTPDTTHSVKFLGLNTAAGLWPASQYGKDVIIGIIDSGIWPESPSFKDDGMTDIPAGWKGICQESPDFNSSLCNKKLIGARYFDAGTREADPGREFTSARDTDGHGSHCASIAAGNFVDGVSFFGYAPGTARGVAPRARIAAYKSGSYESDTLAAIDQAVADGVHIISISLAYESSDLFQNPIAAATFGARGKGVVVCKSAGNSGPSIATMFGGGTPWEVVVASGTVDRWFAGTITLGNGETITGFTMFPARASVYNVPLIYNETVSPCNSAELLSQSFLTRIVVCNITDETVGFDSLMGYLSDSNVAAAIIISEDSSILRSNEFRFPGAVITPREAVKLINYATTSATPNATIEFQQTIIGAVPRAAPALSASSSRGPSQGYQEILKPDIMAPGVLILAAYSPLSNSRPRIGNNIFLSTDYSLESGTSMAAPHIAGVAALLKAAHPEWSPAAIQSAMMTTANHLDSTKQPIKDQAFDRVASPLGIGSGQVDPNRALDPGLIYDSSPQDLANLVCSMNYTREQIRAIIRSSYNCSNPSSDLNYPSFIALFNFDQRGLTLTKTFKRTVTNVGNGAATYRMKLEKPENATVRVSPTTLVFRKKYAKQSYSLSIRFTGDIDSTYRQGSLTWIEDTGKYTVRSPIVISGGVDNYG
ncbi:subtilisin-like protease SBT3 [Salvia miltiorrhiza]|uniref:subtilisin-like protease SBT3 n=1 Tax=Salvia miltiorrhiza TaxID=226208 RepID=UPI0025AD89D0|nr:subtilisin-like protease SBT3 [Salvia miltiorrhiza]